LFKKLAYFILFGNYYYGLCTVALSVETGYQQGIGTNSMVYYLLVFLSTIIYYTYAYKTDTVSTRYSNQRSIWYVQHRKLIAYTQNLFTLTTAIIFFYILANYYKSLLNFSLFNWSLLLVFPIVAVLYYGVVLSPNFKLNLRNQGWLKPFFIGFVWSGAVTIYPVLYHQLETGITYNITWLTGWFFLKNWMFITVLCIMFDIKDYAADHNHQLKTFVVRVGLRKTIFSIIMPLTFLGLASFLVFAFSSHLPTLRVLMNTIPFILLLLVAYSMHQRRPIIYYLAIIDGLMIAKAICGILGVVLVE